MLVWKLTVKVSYWRPRLVQSVIYSSTEELRGYHNFFRWKQRSQEKKHKPKANINISIPSSVSSFVLGIK